MLEPYEGGVTTKVGAPADAATIQAASRLRTSTHAIGDGDVSARSAGGSSLPCEVWIPSAPETVPLRWRSPTSPMPMGADTMHDEPDLQAGDFATWLAAMPGAIRGEHGADVPCGGCTACCTASQFVHIDPTETDTLARIPAELLFPAPGRPRGHLLMGYDEHGHCPMLVDGACSIYEHRPVTCRTYDCRVFPAAGLEPDDRDKVLIARQARRWRFRFATEADRRRRAAVRAAASFFRANPDLLPDPVVPRTTTQLAVLSVELHDLFLDDDVGDAVVRDPDPDEVRVEVRRRTGTPP
jgi:uncharacterized protein